MSGAFAAPLPRPGRVTALAPADAGGHRWSVTVGASADGDSRDGSVLVSAEIIGALGLATGIDLGVQEVEQLSELARQLSVFDRSVVLLAARPRSARDLRVALRRRGAAAHDVDAALERLAGLGLLDDTQYAMSVAASRARLGETRRMTVKRLRQRGVSAEHAEVAARHAFVDDDQESELQAALAVAARRARQLGRLDRTTLRRRLYAFLARRGYPPGTCARAASAASAGAVSDE